jgi:eukaryotic-like serine/threonine-protein kinase
MNRCQRQIAALLLVGLALFLPVVRIGAASAAANLERLIYLPLVNGGYDPAFTAYIPAGEFQMGCDPAHTGGYGVPADAPLHNVFLDAYTIDKFEVTNADYLKCELASACPPPAANSSRLRLAYYNNLVYKDYPVLNVSWEAAASYCTWVGKQLPSEAQWEKAARGSSDTRAYPWGDQEPDCTLANTYNEHEVSDCKGDTTQVGSYPLGVSPYGALDMAGNVWEWVNDWYQADYYSLSPYANPLGPVSGTSKGLRGGSLVELWPYLRVLTRSMAAPLAYDVNIGFRCAGSP